ncbi:hypothetical protein ACLOJK_012931 [Asimina triloba]
MLTEITPLAAHSLSSSCRFLVGCWLIACCDEATADQKGRTDCRSVERKPPPKPLSTKKRAAVVRSSSLSPSDLHDCHRGWLPEYQICYLCGLTFSLVGMDLPSDCSPVMGCASSKLVKMVEHRIWCSSGAPNLCTHAFCYGALQAYL